MERVDNPGDTILIVTKKVYTLNIYCKFQPSIFNTFMRNEFSILFTYKCMQTQPCSHSKMVNLGRPWVLNAIYQDSAGKPFLIWRKKIFKCIYHILVWRPSYLMIPNRLNKLWIPLRQKAQCESDENLSSCFREEGFLRSRYFIHEYCPGSKDS